MLLSKRTQCWRCEGGSLSRRIQVSGYFTFAIDRCNNCRAQKRTILLVAGKPDRFIAQPGDLCGSVEYGLAKESDNETTQA